MQNGRLICDKCGFDPAINIANTKVTARSLLDVHHINPLDEGVRYTTRRRTSASFVLAAIASCTDWATTLSDPTEKAKALKL